MVKLLLKFGTLVQVHQTEVWNQNATCFALQIPLMLALGKGWGGKSNIHYWANNLKYVSFLGFSPYILVRVGHRLTASFMSLKGSCPQIRSTTSELRIVVWEVVHLDEEFRKKKSPQGHWMYLSHGPRSKPALIFHVWDSLKFKSAFDFRSIIN